MANINQNTQPFTVLQIIHGALCLGVVLFLLVTIQLNYGHGRIHSAIEPNDVPMVYVAIALGIVLVIVSNILYKSKIAQIDMAAPVAMRLSKYQTTMIIRLAPLNAAALFNIVVWYLTGNIICACAGAALVLYMILLRPVKSKVTIELQVSYPETLD